MTEPERQPPDIAPVAIEEEMRRSYLDYAMSVIVARALPDVRDGLKPVHRRILHAMKEGGYDWSRPYRKSARIVGDVMGQYHPHGDGAIYDAMVRMAQDFSMRLPLVDGQGNFGSMDGDPPAAHRYTEARLARPAEGLLRDIDKDTVDFVPNYDETAEEPSVLPAEFPNLLVNGAGGIAVGMATNIPPHNLGETIDACLAYIDNPGITVEELMERLPGPDFPTGGVVLGRAGIHAAYRTGRGSIVVRARAAFEETRKDRWAIVVSEIPYQVNKARLMERIAEAARDKTVEGIADLRDESDRDGVRVVVELKREAGQDEAAREVALAQLYRFTPMQTTFGVNMLALNAGRPEQMDLRAVVAAFVAFREEVVARRTRFLLRRARERAHVLAGLLAALANLDAVIAEIRAAADAPAARRALRARAWPAGEVADFIAIVDDPGHKVEDGRYRLSEAQARAILELRLQRLTGMERAKLVEETRELAARIAGYLEILGSRPRLLATVREELERAREAHADPRRTLLEENEFEHDIEDLIPREDMVVTVSLGGYVKRVPLAAYRAQRRGGRGRSGMSTREEDAVSRLFVANTHAPILFFTSRGVVYRMKAYRLPLAAPQARGKAIVNLLPLEPGEWIQAVMPTPAGNGDGEGGPEAPHLMFATAAGTVRRNALSDFERIARNGKIAMRLEEGDRLIDVRPCAEGDDVLLATRAGRAARFAASDVRVFRGRGSTGVRGVRLAPGDEVVSMSILRGPAEGDNGDSGGGAETAAPGPSILTVTETGMGKRAPAAEYRRTGRGARGVLNIDAAGRAGRVVAAFPVEDGDHVMLVTDAGQTIRCAAGEVRETGRRSMGVRVFRLGEGERVVSAGPAGEENGAPAPEPGPSRERAQPPTD